MPAGNAPRPGIRHYFIFSVCLEVLALVVLFLCARQNEPGYGGYLIAVIALAARAFIVKALVASVLHATRNKTMTGWLSAVAHVLLYLIVFKGA
jgi:hypothetical protein